MQEVTVKASEVKGGSVNGDTVCLSNWTFKCIRAGVDGAGNIVLSYAAGNVRLHPDREVTVLR